MLLLYKTQIRPLSKQEKRFGDLQCLLIRQLPNEVKLSYKSSFSFASCCIKFNLTSHPEPIQKLYRFHDEILLTFETASDLIWGSFWNLKITQIALRSLTDFVLVGHKRASNASKVNYTFLTRCMAPSAASTPASAPPPARPMQ